MKIITLTLNPAFDVHCQASGLTLHRENLAHIRSVDAGGKGVNLSRALSANGISNTPVVVLGEENGELFCQRLNEEGIVPLTFCVSGRIRENMTFHEEGAPETRISFPGFCATNDLIDRLEQQILPLCQEETIITLTGRLPEGISMERAQRFLLHLRQGGVRTVIDSRSFDRESLLHAKPWLIKPNEEEISIYGGRAVTTLAEAASVAQELCAHGIENVMISLGSQGAVLCCPAGTYLAHAPSIQATSTVGAGDSAIAGFLTAFSKGFSANQCLQYAVAFGSAACLREGTAPPLPQDIRRLLEQITVQRLS